MAVVFDIETTGTPFAQLAPSVQEYLLRGAETEEQAEAARRRTALQPFTGEVACIALYDTARDRGTVLYREPPSSPAGAASPEAAEPGPAYRRVADERELLEQFWKGAAGHGQFVTFNGRRFDIPYLVIRSGIRGVKVTRDLLGNRYRVDVHVDLYDQLSFQGAADRHFNLDMVCHAFGVHSPKSEEAHGYKVQEMWESGRGYDIARYCYGDVLATAELYRRWHDFMQC